MKLPTKLLVNVLLILVGFPLVVLWLFTIEKWDQFGYEYRDRARHHGGALSWARMRRKNLERVVSGKTRIEDNPGVSLDIFGLEEGELRDIPHLRSKIKQFAAIEAHNEKLFSKYDRAYRYFWFLPTSPDPTPPVMP